MAINVNAANQQAAEIAAKVNRLRMARNELGQYRTELQSNWQGQEVGLFVQSIDAEIAKIDALIGTLNSIGTDIRNTAAAIKREEEAAAKAAAEKAAQQKRMAQARSAYNAACNALDAIVRERETIVEQMRNTKSLATMTVLNMKLIEIDKRLSDAQEVCNQCRLALG